MKINTMNDEYIAARLLEEYGSETRYKNHSDADMLKAAMILVQRYYHIMTNYGGLMASTLGRETGKECIPVMYLDIEDKNMSASPLIADMSDETVSRSDVVITNDGNIYITRGASSGASQIMDTRPERSLYATVDIMRDVFHHIGDQVRHMLSDEAYYSGMVFTADPKCAVDIAIYLGVYGSDAGAPAMSHEEFKSILLPAGVDAKLAEVQLNAERNNKKRRTK